MQAGKIMNGGDDDGVEKNVLAFGDRVVSAKIRYCKNTHTPFDVQRAMRTLSDPEVEGIEVDVEETRGGYRKTGFLYVGILASNNTLTHLSINYPNIMAEDIMKAAVAIAKPWSRLRSVSFNQVDRLRNEDILAVIKTIAESKTVEALCILSTRKSLSEYNLQDLYKIVCKNRVLIYLKAHSVPFHVLTVPGSRYAITQSLIDGHLESNYRLRSENPKAYDPRHVRLRNTTIQVFSQLSRSISPKNVETVEIEKVDIYDKVDVFAYLLQFPKLRTVRLISCNLVL